MKKFLIAGVILASSQFLQAANAAPSTACPAMLSMTSIVYLKAGFFTAANTTPTNRGACLKSMDVCKKIGARRAREFLDSKRNDELPIEFTASCISADGTAIDGYGSARKANPKTDSNTQSAYEPFMWGNPKAP